MERLAVAFDDEPARHKEVHTAHAIDLLLHLERYAERAQHQPQETLGARLSATIQQVAQPAIATWQRGEQLVKVFHSEQAMVQCGVQRRDCGAWHLAPHGVDERVEDLDAQRRRMRGPP